MRNILQILALNKVILYQVTQQKYGTVRKPSHDFISQEKASNITLVPRGMRFLSQRRENAGPPC